ncbi:MAG: very short patch repair endonuclease [Alphaproteobacteria bacterium]|nr:very short patch repair endonuclease [Alphaproteobacteria bacterium]
MAKITGKGNRSTEIPLLEFLRSEGVEGWETHPPDVVGRPDLYFRDLRLAIFVDGCFWHDCPVCARNRPRTRREFWDAKITANRQRDSRVTRTLRRQGISVLRLWEHRIRSGGWEATVKQMLTRARRRAQ